MVVGTAKQEIEQGVATSGQATVSTIPTKKERVWQLACQASNVDLCDKSQNPLNVDLGLATKYDGCTQNERRCGSRS